MEFRLLGPVEAVRDGESIPLGAPKQRALAAVLLLSANEVFARDRLIDQLWGAEPPRSAVQSLQVYVHGLRQALGGDRIETHGTGYRIRVEPGELDVEEFERLVDRGERELAEGRPADASDDLRSALDLWRGSPLADLGGELVGQAEAPRLEDRRLRAVELRNDAELALGNHEELVVELERLIAAEPYRERFRVQQMLALYRAGRQKEALEAYRSAREALVDELGVEPSPALQELERKMLRQDPSLAAPAAPQRGTVELPIPPTPLLGRRLEAAAVQALLRRDDVRLVTLTGTGGTGKTRLALAIAAELGSELRDGAVFVDLAPIRDPGLLATTIAHAVGIEDSGESLEEQLVAHLKDRSLLLLLDNLEQLLPDVTLVSKLLASAPRLLVLATSRAPLRLSGEHVYAVPPLAAPQSAVQASFEELSANEAVRLFVARAQAADPSFELSDENIQSVAEICGRLDGLPLAIELAAARVRLVPPDIGGGKSLDVLTDGARDLPARHQTLRATLEWSHDLLDAEARMLFPRLAVFAGGWTLAAAGSVCMDDGADPLESLSSLVDGNLVRRVSRAGAPRFGMLETIREYAGELLAASGELAAVRRRHADYIVELAEAANEQIMTSPEPDAAYDLFEEEHDNLRAALEWAAESDEPELEVRLAVAARWFWIVRGHLGEGRRVFERILARADLPRPSRAAALGYGASFPFRQGDLALAKTLWTEGLDLYRELDDADGIGRCIGELGGVAIAEGDLDRAIELYEEATGLYREQGNKQRLGTALANLGAIANLNKQPEVAVEYFEQAIELGRELGALDEIAISQHNRARSLIALERLDEARAALDESISLGLRLGYREVLAYCLGGLAELAMERDDAEEAALMLGAAQSQFEQLGAAMDPDEAETQQRVLDYTVARFGQDAVTELRTRGAAMSPAELVA
jgi:predicted ATPase/DNA-binding SARP family transcriptional activator